jgi:tRNA nucleotidyltransferase (CCA-adding enzyme)
LAQAMHAETVIATHTNTDFDAFASQLAARRLYPDAAIALPGSLNRNVRDFCRLHAGELDVLEAARVDVAAIRRLIVVETVSAVRLGELEAAVLDPTVEKVLFDHHAAELPAWADPATSVISEDGALTTTLIGVIAERELAVTPLEATVFALGIHEDTGSLTYPTATPRDADALAWCFRHGARQESVASFLHMPLAEDERALLDALVDALETHRVGGIDVLISAVAWPSYVDGVSNLAHKIVDLTDCQALVVLVEMDTRVFAVTRSRVPEVDAAALAGTLGGGGHAPAASAIFRGPLGDARRRVVEGLPHAVSSLGTASDVMSSPVRTVGPDESVARAMVVCQRHGVSGILVAESGEVVGAVGREDLDKAIGHGLSHAPVKAIMSGGVPTATETTPLPELRRLLTTVDAGRIAILRDGKLAGVVTRTDLRREPPHEEPQPAASIEGELEALDRLRPAFEAIASASDGYDGVYLVGGTVRDILLGEEGFDVDIAVEGDAIELAGRIASELGGRSRPHEKFGTAVVLYGEGERIDVVTARTEFYDAPAALPTVEHATIREDLFRRDFTINAMATSLKGDDFGRLVDPFGGRRDLAEGTIRILHNLSFIDDPTRIFRAIRYENRYRFRMDASTARLARGCIDMGLVGDLSSSRLRDELVGLLDEDDVAHTILRLAELGADRAIHPHLAADDEAVRLTARLRSLQDEFGVEVPAWRLRLAVLARRLPPDEAYAWLERLRMRRRDAEHVVSAITVGPRLVERLGREKTDAAEVVALADPYAPDAPLFALALEEISALRDYFARLRNIRLAITGADLAELGLAESPRVGEVLDELRRRKLRGDLDGRESELAAARELIDG